MNIFMTGATGFLGGRLARELIARGHRLCVLARTPQKVTAMFTKSELRSIDVLAGDLTAPLLGADEAFIQSNVDQFDLVLHMAALVKFDEELREELFDTNLTGTRQALALTKALHCPRFFHVSTAYTLGAREAGDETLYATDQPFHNPYEESKAHAEREVWAARHDLAVSIFRPAIIVGDSKTGEADSKFTMYGYMRALEVFKRRLERRGAPAEPIRLLGSETGTSNLVPVDYVANVLLAAIEHARPNMIYNVTNDAPPRNETMLEYMKQALAFPHLKITETQSSKLSNVEHTFNEMVKVFNPYLNRNIVFNDQNTKQLLADAGYKPLDLDERSLRRIVDAYYDTK
ncbi:NAD-dependent epimerase/dehydratase family protein [Exiguobacterium sp. SH3S2]|uniref:SDR family oxidoreductase n=1 Tax=unclassified Exiguobacterium TaxID=2644629 RepID=UPI00103B81D9|nr:MULTISPECIES: SDR family oxidoreductase [unclassified Exiguobacterium]TCI42118.1 NAD-dependent epimerase/dehydratase family protein [Exiguobacterium sp. SH3S3]TCI58362.1 NAD-dependent epimerase/dehydratase family protein [Exiguobacterium sp. SH3S2]